MTELITRADDLASSHAANRAINKAIDAGFIQNVSVMAVSPVCLAQAADMMAQKNVCFGVHLCLNSEWDRNRWRPLTPGKTIRDADGFFYQDPKLFPPEGIDLDEVMSEVNAQYQAVKAAGFPVQYAEFHMFPELTLPGLQQRLSTWLAEERLLDFWNYLVPFLPQMDRLAHQEGLFEEVLSNLPEGRYFYVAHPAEYCEEMRQTGNAIFPGKLIAKARQADSDFLTNSNTLEICKKYNVVPTRLDNATPGNYLTADEAAKLLYKKEDEK